MHRYTRKATSVLAAPVSRVVTAAAHVTVVSQASQVKNVVIRKRPR